MLWIILVTLLFLWLLGFVSGFQMDNFIHIPLFLAIIAMLIQIEDDCRDYGSGRMSKKNAKRQSVDRSGKMLPNLELAMLSGEKVSQPTISPQTYREG